MSQSPDFIPLQGYQAFSGAEMASRAEAFQQSISNRRTVRDFSNQPISRQVIESCLKAAVSAPSGANMQPWHFVVVSDSEIKHRIRLAAEEEERHFYSHRASEEWLEALAPIGTDANKAFLETAPYLIAIFLQKYTVLPNGEKAKHYYPMESVGLATGILITALHHAGLATLTHTPSPMGFLNEILGRPKDTERPFLLLVTGYPAEDAKVPNIQRKPFSSVVSFV